MEHHDYLYFEKRFNSLELDHKAILSKIETSGPDSYVIPELAAALRRLGLRITLTDSKIPDKEPKKG